MPEEIRIKDIDVLVIGGGIGGSYAAVKAKEAGAGRVVQVDKGHVGKSGNSAFAAGVMHVYFPGEQDLQDRIRRLARSLGYVAQQDMIQDYLEDSFNILQELDGWGVEFVKTQQGQYEKRPGRGYYPIVMFHGYKLMDVLRKVVRKFGVEQIHKTMMTALITEKGRVVGAVGFNVLSGDFYVFEAKATVMATGSTWYKGKFPGQRDTTGDGYAAAFEAGAVLSGAENNDFVSNLLPARFDIGPGMNKYVGEGGVFYNSDGERFMQKYNPKLKERCGLPILVSTFCMEARRGKIPISMNMTHFTREQINRLREVLPLPMKMFERSGLLVGDRFSKPIEWGLASPIARPGLFLNRHYETSLPGLYACGEAASPQSVVTGLASAATSGAMAGRHAAQYADQQGPGTPPNPGHVGELKAFTFQPLEKKEGIEPDQVLLAVQEMTIPYDRLLLREGERMKEALREVEDIRKNQVPFMGAYDYHYLRMAHEARNLALVAEIHLRTALMRKESRTLLREDYPHTDNENWLKWILVKKTAQGMELTTEPVPMETYPVVVERNKPLHHLWQIAKDQQVITIEDGRVTWV